MFNFVYNDLDSDNYLNNEYDKNSSSIQILDSYESLDSQKNFLNNKTKQKTYKEEKSHTFKKEKKIDEFNEKKKIKDNISSKGNSQVTSALNTKISSASFNIDLAKPIGPAVSIGVSSLLTVIFIL